VNLQGKFGVNTRRVEITVSCRDADLIPKVHNAGLFVGESESIQVMHNGVQVVRDCYDGDWMTEIITKLRGHHEPQEEVVFNEVLKVLHQSSKTPVMIELGSYWCYYTSWFLKEFAHGKAICVEPDYNNLEVGRKNLELNGQNAQFVNGLIGKESQGFTEFFCHSSSEYRNVSNISLETLMFENNAESIDILHADIQGAELNLLENYAHFFKRGVVRFLFISTHHVSISNDEFTHEKCLEKLKELGAVIIAEHNVFESFSGDGLIVASFNSNDSQIKVEISRAKPWESLFGTWGEESQKELKMRRDEVIYLNELGVAKIREVEELKTYIANQTLLLEAGNLEQANLVQKAIDVENRMIILSKTNQSLENRILKLLANEQQLATIRAYKTFRILAITKRILRKITRRS
jgi:FkbM family methyltransferase